MKYGDNSFRNGEFHVPLQSGTWPERGRNASGIGTMLIAFSFCFHFVFYFVRIRRCVLNAPVATAPGTDKGILGGEGQAFYLSNLRRCSEHHSIRKRRDHVYSECLSDSSCFVLTRRIRKAGGLFLILVLAETGLGQLTRLWQF